jgi:hypothetical protein
MPFHGNTGADREKAGERNDAGERVDEGEMQKDAVD